MEKSRLLYLIKQHEQQILSASETEELNGWYENTTTSSLLLFTGVNAEAEKDALYNKVQAGLYANNIVRMEKRSWLLKRVAAAAIILVTLCFGIIRITNKKSELLVAATEYEKTLKSTESLPNITIRNISKQDTENVLPDGSTIKLAAGSSLSYTPAYGINSREVTLIGKCYFSVHKDSLRPFIVYSAGISTKALGTSFTIYAIPNAAHVKVQLHTGKVVIQQQGAITKHSFKTVFLNAGESFDWNQSTALYTVNTIPEQLPKKLKITKPEIDFHFIGYEKNYDRIALSEMMDDLTKAYQVDIKYTLEEVDNMQFSGAITKSDSLPNVLKRIALLNDLLLQQTGTHEYKLSKK